MKNIMLSQFYFCEGFYKKNFMMYIFKQISQLPLTRILKRILFDLLNSFHFQFL